MTNLLKYKVHFLVLLTFIFITYLYFPRLFSGFFTTVETNDGRLVAALISWDIHKLVTDPFHIFQANFFFPNKNVLAYTEHFIGAAFLGIPVWLFTGGNPAATFNFLMIFGYLSNAFVTFLLIRKLINKNAIAFLGAFINGYCSYRLFNIAHLQDIIVFYIPLCLLFFYHYFDSKKTKYLLGIGLCLFFQSLSSWYHMVFIFLMFFLVTGYYFLNKRITNRDLKRIISTCIITFIFIVPFAIPYLKQNQLANTAYSMSDIASADFGGYFIPSPYTYGNQFFYNYWGVSKSRWTENFNFIGYAALLFAFLGIFKVYRNGENKIKTQFQKDNSVFLIIGLVFFILSLGPYVVLNDRQTHIKLPYYYIFKMVSPIRFLRTVSRYSTVVFLMISILASYGLAAFIMNVKGSLFRSIIYTLLFVILVIEYAPQPRFDRFSDMTTTPDVYKKIKNDSTIKAIVEFPIDVEPFTTTKYIYYAGIHFKPIVNGYSGYEPPSYSQYKNLLKTPLNQFTVGVLLQLGITDILCNPEYKQPIDPKWVDLTMEAEGYRLYKIKKQNIPSIYSENMGQYERALQQTDNSLHIEKDTVGVTFYPANELILTGYLSPRVVNKLSSITYTSNKPLDELEIEFRAYSSSDTLRIICSMEGTDKRDSLVKVYTYTNINEFNEKYVSLPLYQANKIKLELFASVFCDRTFIRNLLFIKR